MGLGRLIRNRELKSDLKTLKQCTSTELIDIRTLVSTFQAELSMAYRLIGLYTLLDGEESYNPAVHRWGHYPLEVSKFRFTKTPGGTHWLAASIILHSVRAALDVEMNNNTKALLTCKVLWHTLYEGDIEDIPPRFR